MRKTRPPYRPKSRWFVVERWMTCLGVRAGSHHPEVKAHDVKVGTRMRWSAQGFGTATCEDCLLLQERSVNRVDTRMDADV
jgi:hypothetical protein